MAFAKLELYLIGKLSPSALLVYTLMRDRAEYDDTISAWMLRYKIKTIAEMCSISERSCKQAIAELEAHELMNHDRTGRSSIYIIMPPERWKEL